MGSITNQGLQTTDKRLYFLCIDTRDRLEIQFVPPVLNLSRDANLATITIVGRNTPKYQDAGGETTLSFDLDFYADEQSRSSVISKCNWLMSLTFTDKGRKPTKRIALVFGDLFKYEIWKVKTVTPKISDFSKPHGFLPKQAYVNIVLCLDVDYNLGWDDVNVQYQPGAPDGSNPVPLDRARRDDENYNLAWEDVVNDNSFKAIAERAFERLGLVSTFTHGYVR